MITTLSNKKIQSVTIFIIATIFCALFFTQMGDLAYLLNVTNLAPTSALTLLIGIISGTTSSLPLPLQTLLPQVQPTVMYLWNYCGIVTALGF